MTATAIHSLNNIIAKSQNLRTALCIEEADWLQVILDNDFGDHFPHDKHLADSIVDGIVLYEAEHEGQGFTLSLSKLFGQRTDKFVVETSATGSAQATQVPVPVRRDFTSLSEAYRYALALTALDSSYDPVIFAQLSLPEPTPAEQTAIQQLDALVSELIADNHSYELRIANPAAEGKLSTIDDILDGLSDRYDTISFLSDCEVAAEDEPVLTPETRFVSWLSDLSSKCASAEDRAIFDFNVRERFAHIINTVSLDVSDAAAEQKPAAGLRM